MRFCISNFNIEAVFINGNICLIDEFKTDEERIIKVVTKRGRKYSIDKIEYFLVEGVRREKDETFGILNSIF